MPHDEFDDFADIDEAALPKPRKPSDETILSPDTLAQEPHKRRLEDLTLAELLGQFMRSPFKTWRGLTQIASQPPAGEVIVVTESPSPEAITQIDTTTQLSLETPTDHDPNAELTPEQRETFREARRQFLKLGLYVVAYGLAVWGSIILVAAEIRYESAQLDRGAPFLLAGFLLWLFAEFSDEFHATGRFNPARWLNRKGGKRATDETIPNPARLEETSTTSPFANTWAMHPVRIFSGIGMLFFSAVAWIGNPQNQFTGVGFWGWLAAITCTVLFFAPKSWSVNRLYANFSTWLMNIKWFSPSVFIMLTILIIGTAFRFHDLYRVPPEMTSDHIEKLINVHQILNGDRSIFFTNNGGRESFHMYVLALFSQFTGMELGFTLLKVVAIIESIITLPFLWWLGREVIGEKDRKLGNAVGLALAALVAVSYWHLAITRLSLRIILTPLVATLLLGFLIRALRYNRRGDFIMAGLVLGWGLYTYQAVRMMPVFIILAVVWIVWCRLRQRGQWRVYLGHLTVLVVVSFVVFIPLFRFSVEYPTLFWMRTEGRLFGDDVIQTIDENGIVRERIATIGERIEAFNKNFPILSDNIRNALLMYNWKSDVAWISAYPNYPAMDTITGAFLIVGLAAWLGYMIIRKDGLLLIVPLMVVIMLLPSALSIAQPIENPSATRTSGSLPAVYLIAALPIGLFVSQMGRVFKQLGVRIGVVMITGLIIIALSLNSQTYFDKYYQTYIPQSLPHSEAGRILRGFAMSDGAYGNAFLISYPHWFDDRTVGLEGGNIEWEATHGIDVSFLYVPNVVSDAYYCPNRTMRLDVDKDLLFFYHQKDDAMEANLRLWFPNGRTTVIHSYQPNDDFKIYRVPALGEAGFRAFAYQFTANPACAVP
ncbi:MAG: hypothetical protein CUN52_06740 [Phototrophicales bacterium]|nr:MAG: hypothetical protein CUN52_06740 [Phototrophicales bacterium]